MATLVRWVFVVLAMINMIRAQTEWTDVFSGDYTEYNAKNILSIRTDLIDTEIGGPGGPGDIFFLSELTRSEFMVAFHPERGEIAIRNAKYAHGESKWGFQWVDIEFPFLETYIEGDYHTYSVAFVGDKVVLAAEGRRLLTIPLIELCDDVDEYLNSIYGARFEYTYTSTMLEYSFDVLPTIEGVQCKEGYRGYEMEDGKYVCDWTCEQDDWYNVGPLECERCPDGATSEPGSYSIDDCKCPSGSVMRYKESDRVWYCAVGPSEPSKIGDATILSAAMSNTYCRTTVDRCWPNSLAIDGKWNTRAQTWYAKGVWFEVNIERALVHQVVLKAGVWSGSGIKVTLYSKGRKVGKCPVKKGYGRKNGVTLDCDRVEADKVKVTVSTKKGKLSVYEIRVKTIAL